MTSRFLLVLAAGFSFNAFAYDGPNECNITQNTVLTADSVAKCENFSIAPGVTVVTHEFAFRRRADAQFVCGTPDQPCHIKCVGDGDTYDMGNKLCGRTEVRAVIASGASDIENETGKVNLAFTGYAPTYRQKVNVGPYGQLTIHLNDDDVTETDAKYRWFN